MKQIITASAGGVDIEKYYDESELPVPAVVYEISSERQETVEIRIVESVPVGLDKDHIGFHGEFTRDVWTIENGQLIFEHLIEGDSTYRTVYALKPNSPFETEELVSEPVELDIEPAGHAKEFVSEDPTWSVESTIADGETEPASEPDPTGESSTEGTDSNGGERTAESSAAQHAEAAEGSDEFADIFADEGDETNRGSRTDGTTTGTRSRADGGAEDSDSILDARSPTDSETDTGRSPTVPDTDAGSEPHAESDSVVEQLVSEIKSGSVPEEDIEYLRQELGASTGVPESVDARINKLQADVADLQAYTEALERFIDTHGQAEDAVDSFTRRLDDIDEKVAAIDATVSDREGELRAIHEQLHELGAALESSSEELASARAQIEELSTATGELEEQMPAYDIEQRFEEVEDEIENLSEFTSSLESAFSK